MIQVIPSMQGNVSSSTIYYPLMGYGSAGAEVPAQCIFPTAGTLSNFSVSVTAAGAGKTRTLAININGTPTLSVTVSGASQTTGVDTGSIAVAAGDIVSIKSSSTGSPFGGTGKCSVLFEGDTAGESVLLGNSVTALHTSATRYVAAYGGNSCISTEIDAQQIIPTPGTLKKLYWGLSADPGTNPDTYTMTLRVNGSSSTLTSAIVADNTTGNDTGHNVSVSAGDRIDLMIVPSQSPLAAPSCFWGMVFVSDTDGESLILGGSTDALNNTTEEYNYIGVQAAAWSTTEPSLLLQACTLKKFYVELSGSPRQNHDTEDYYQFDVRVAGSDSGIVATVADGGTGNLKANDTAHTADVTDGQALSLSCTPASSPTVRDAYWGLVCYISVSQTYNEDLTLAIAGGMTRADALSAINSVSFPLSAGLTRSVLAEMVDAIVLALSADQDQAGGMTFEEAVTLAVQAAEARAGILSCNEALILALQADDARSANTEMNDGVSLGMTASLARSSVLTAMEAFAFGIAVSKAVAGGTDFYEAVILTVNAIGAQAATVEMEAGLSLGISADQGTGSTAEMDAVIALSLAMAMLQSETVEAGVSTYNEAATLATSMGMSQSAIGTLHEAVTLATAVGQNQSGQSILINALVLQATASMIRSSIGLLSTSAGFGISAGEDFGTALILQASVLLGAKGDLSGIGGLSFDDEASFDAKSGMSQSVVALLSAAVNLNAQASQGQMTVLTAEARIALDVACEQIEVALRTHNLSLALSIVADMQRWGIVPRLAAAKFTFDAIARQREYDATARQREYDATSKERENDDD